MIPASVVEPGIVWQQRDFGQASEHDQIAVAARSDPHQRRPRPRVDQPAARAAIEHHRGAVGRIDQTRAADSVVTGQDRGDLGAVPSDQFRGAFLCACGPMVDATRVAVVGIGCHDPDLAACRAIGCDLTCQPMAVGGMKDAGDGALDGQFDVARRTRPPAAQETLHGAREAAVVDKVGERGRVRRHRRAIDPTDLRSHRIDSAWSRGPPTGLHRVCRGEGRSAIA